ncbi:MAG TPA: outer membrane lipoprotein carrier protein LolA [Terriglobales bacterium]
MKFSAKSDLGVATTLLLITVHAWCLPDVHQLASAVDAHYNHLRSLQAEFTEIYQGAGTERTESGTLWLKKPGKMRWEYRSPEEKLFVGNGDDAWLYLPAEKQVRKSNVRKLEDLRSPLAFLLGKSKLEKELNGLAFAPEVQPWKAGDSVLRGAPRGLEGRVQSILIEVTPEHQITRILIQGVDDSITEYRLSDQKEDLQLPDSRFRFTAPAGSETIEDETGQ